MIQAYCKKQQELNNAVITRKTIFSNSKKKKVKTFLSTPSRQMGEAEV
jgi:hypothetical protein